MPDTHRPPSLFKKSDGKKTAKKSGTYVLPRAAGYPVSGESVLKRAFSAMAGSFRAMRARGDDDGDAMARRLASAPIDDVPLSAEEELGLEEGLADFKAGRYTVDPATVRR